MPRGVFLVCVCVCVCVLGGSGCVECASCVVCVGCCGCAWGVLQGVLQGTLGVLPPLGYSVTACASFFIFLRDAVPGVAHLSLRKSNVSQPCK